MVTVNLLTSSHIVLRTLKCVVELLGIHMNILMPFFLLTRAYNLNGPYVDGVALLVVILVNTSGHSWLLLLVYM